MSAMPHHFGQSAPRIVKARRDRGFIVIAVLWILAALATLVLVYSNYMVASVISVVGSTDRVQNEAALSAAIEMSCFRLLAGDNAMFLGSGRLQGRVGGATFSTVYVSESARIDINLAPKELLAGLMVSLGQPQDAADYFATRIIAWRAPLQPQAGDDDPENNAYRTAGLLYLPRHGPFPALEELWLVWGVPRPVVAAMMPFVTVFSGQPWVNVVDAPAQVLAALPTMTPLKLQNLLGTRAVTGIDPAEVLAQAEGGQFASTERSKAIRISVQVNFTNGRSIGSEAVALLIGNGGEPYRLLSRRDILDGGPRNMAQGRIP